MADVYGIKRPYPIPEKPPPEPVEPPRYQEVPSDIKRHRWNLSRCQVVIMVPYQKPGEYAKPITAHPVRLGSSPRCEYHFGNIYLDKNGYAGFGVCTQLSTVGPYLRTVKDVLCKMIVALEDNLFGFSVKEIMKKNHAYGVAAIDNCAWCYGMWFSGSTAAWD